MSGEVHTRLPESNGSSLSQDNSVRTFRLGTALVLIKGSPGLGNTLPHLNLKAICVAGILDALKLHWRICFYSDKTDNTKAILKVFI